MAALQHACNLIAQYNVTPHLVDMSFHLLYGVLERMPACNVVVSVVMFHFAFLSP
jgi:hypothetical protein